MFKYAQGWVEVYHYDLGFFWLHLFIYRTSIGQKNWKQGFCIGRFRKEKPRTKITPHSEEEAYPLVTFTNLFTYGDNFMQHKRFDNGMFDSEHSNKDFLKT